MNEAMGTLVMQVFMEFIIGNWAYDELAMAAHMARWFDVWETLP